VLLTPYPKGGSALPVTIGSNLFFGVPFPLVLADRFFHIYQDGARFTLDVFRWDSLAKTASYEVIAGAPQNETITTNPTGIVTFAEEGAGVFLFKFRPKPGISQIFGRVPVDEEWSVRISDARIVVERGGIMVVTLEDNQFEGLAIGMQLGADGASLGIGIAQLPEGMELSRKP
jgi:hypothetical protein